MTQFSLFSQGPLVLLDDASGRIVYEENVIDAAEKAWPAWRARPAAERAALLERWYQAVDMFLAYYEVAGKGR